MFRIALDMRVDHKTSTGVDLGIASPVGPILLSSEVNLWAYAREPIWWTLVHYPTSLVVSFRPTKGQLFQKTQPGANQLEYVHKK